MSQRSPSSAPAIDPRRRARAARSAGPAADAPRRSRRRAARAGAVELRRVRRTHRTQTGSRRIASPPTCCSSSPRTAGSTRTARVSRCRPWPTRAELPLEDAAFDLYTRTVTSPVSARAAADRRSRDPAAPPRAPRRREPGLPVATHPSTGIEPLLALDTDTDDRRVRAAAERVAGRSPAGSGRSDAASCRPPS